MMGKNIISPVYVLSRNTTMRRHSTVQMRMKIQNNSVNLPLFLDKSAKMTTIGIRCGDQNETV